MMSHFLRRISKLGMFMGNLVASGAGCLVFTSGFRLVAMCEENSDSDSSTHTGGGSAGRLAGVAAAIFLLLFITSEAVAAVAALQR
jgi:hypothetical protein